MALNRKLLTISSPGSTGNQTYSLDSGFDPKLVIGWTSYQGSAGGTDGDKAFIQGYGTYRGSTVQQWHEGSFYDDANAADVGVRIRGSDAFLKAVEALGTTTAFEVDLVSMGSGASSDVVLNWVDLPASTIKVHLFVLGGSDITDALVGSFTMSTSATPQNVTVAASFGNPNLVLFPGGPWTSTANTQDDIRIALGAAKSSTERRAATFGNNHNQANMTLGAIQKDRLQVVFGASPVIDGELELNDTGHANGFTIDYADQPSFAFIQPFVAINGTFTATITSYDAPTSTGTQDLALASGTPKAALLWGTHTAANAGALDTSSSRLGGFWIGAYDGTDEGSAGMCNEDAAGTVFAGWHHSETKAVVHLDATSGAPTVVADADASFVGSSLRLTWTTVDSVQARGNVLILGEAGGTTHERSASLSATGTITAAAFQRDLNRQIAVSGTGSIATVPERDLERQAAITATGTIATLPERDLQRQASLTATGTITATGEHDLNRTAALAATATIEVRGEIEGQVTTHERAANLSATATIATAGQRDLERSASVAATGNITTAAIRVHQRTAAIAGTASLDIGAHERDLNRQATLDATGTISTGRQVDHNRQLDLTAVGSIDVTPFTGRPWTYAGTPDAAYNGDPVATYGGQQTATYDGVETATYDGDPDWTYTPVS